jgi:hypothetical protein
MSKLPGDIIAEILKPFVKGTKYEDCNACRQRKDKINKFFTNLIGWAKGLFKRK